MRTIICITLLATLSGCVNAVPHYNPSLTREQDRLVRFECHYKAEMMSGGNDLFGALVYGEELGNCLRANGYIPR